MKLNFLVTIKMITSFLTLFILTIVFTPIFSEAQSGSGACSSHNGVNCSYGRQYDGKVMCNDGWSESIVEYDYVVLCQTGVESENMTQLLMKQQKYVSPLREGISSLDTANNFCMTNMYRDTVYVQRVNRCSEYAQAEFYRQMNTPQCPSNATLGREVGMLNDVYCECNDGYYNYENQGFCSEGEKPISYEEKMTKLKSDIQNAKVSVPPNKNQLCENKYGIHSEWDGLIKSDGTFSCYCRLGSGLNKEQTSCIKNENQMPQLVPVFESVQPTSTQQTFDGNKNNLIPSTTTIPTTTNNNGISVTEKILLSLGAILALSILISGYRENKNI